ncbi:MAG: hypothetical protein K0R12_191 [Gammaproteobacteria bacterium]|nr:hypothetical protein [Gammaproteobacteria bacterium]
MPRKTLSSKLNKMLDEKVKKIINDISVRESALKELAAKLELGISLSQKTGDVRVFKEVCKIEDLLLKLLEEGTKDIEFLEKRSQYLSVSQKLTDLVTRVMAKINAFYTAKIQWKLETENNFEEAKAALTDLGEIHKKYSFTSPTPMDVYFQQYVAIAIGRHVEKGNIISALEYLEKMNPKSRPGLYELSRTIEILQYLYYMLVYFKGYQHLDKEIISSNALLSHFDLLSSEGKSEEKSKIQRLNIDNKIVLSIKKYAREIWDQIECNDISADQNQIDTQISTGALYFLILLYLKDSERYSFFSSLKNKFDHFEINAGYQKDTLIDMFLRMIGIYPPYSEFLKDAQNESILLSEEIQLRNSNLLDKFHVYALEKMAYLGYVEARADLALMRNDRAEQQDAAKEGSAVAAYNEAVDLFEELKKENGRSNLKLILDLLERASLKSNFYDPLLKLSEVYCFIENYDKAIEHARRAAQYNRPEAWYNLACYLCKKVFIANNFPQIEEISEIIELFEISKKEGYTRAAVNLASLNLHLVKRCKQTILWLENSSHLDAAADLYKQILLPTQLTLFHCVEAIDLKIADKKGRDKEILFSSIVALAVKVFEVIISFTDVSWKDRYIPVFYNSIIALLDYGAAQTENDDAFKKAKQEINESYAQKIDKEMRFDKRGRLDERKSGESGLKLIMELYSILGSENINNIGLTLQRIGELFRSMKSAGRRILQTHLTDIRQVTQDLYSAVTANTPSNFSLSTINNVLLGLGMLNLPSDDDMVRTCFKSSLHTLSNDIVSSNSLKDNINTLESFSYFELGSSSSALDFINIILDRLNNLSLERITFTQIASLLHSLAIIDANLAFREDAIFVEKYSVLFEKLSGNLKAFLEFPNAFSFTLHKCILAIDYFSLSNPQIAQKISSIPVFNEKFDYLRAEMTKVNKENIPSAMQRYATEVLTRSHLFAHLESEKFFRLLPGDLYCSEERILIEINGPSHYRNTNVYLTLSKEEEKEAVGTCQQTQSTELETTPLDNFHCRYKELAYQQETGNKLKVILLSYTICDAGEEAIVHYIKNEKSETPKQEGLLSGSRYTLLAERTMTYASVCAGASSIPSPTI